MTPSAPSAWFSTTLDRLVSRRDLNADQMRELMSQLLAGSCSEAQTSALLVALHMKGETAEELAAAAEVMRQHCQPVDTRHDDILDTCGTGGDSSGTFNISTITALVVAAAGVRVVKHGNRAISSASGSADVLTELGVTITGDPEHARLCLQRVGMAFCMAPLYHPALRHVGQVRRMLGIRTFFNCLGPLANPANARYQLLGVGREEWLDRMAGALARLGSHRAFLVHARDGLDEVSLGAPTDVRLVCGGEVRSLVWTAEDFGLEPCSIEQLRVSNAGESAQLIRTILAGEPVPPARVVLANAAAALLVVGCVKDLREGVQRAADALYDGRTNATLQALILETGRAAARTTSPV